MQRSLKVQPEMHFYYQRDSYCTPTKFNVIAAAFVALGHSVFFHVLYVFVLARLLPPINDKLSAFDIEKLLYKIVPQKIEEVKVVWVCFAGI